MKKRLRKYMYNVVMSTLLKFYPTKELADELVDVLKEKFGYEYDVYTTMNDGIVLRRRKDNSASDIEIFKAFAKSVKNLIFPIEEDFASYVEDNSDAEYDEKEIGEGFSEEMLDITTKGRLLYIEFDM